MSGRRRVLPLLAAAALLSAGCATAGDTAGAGPETADRLTIAIQEDRGPVNLFAGVSEPLAELVYDKLVAPSPYVDAPQPWLATAVRAIDPSTWEVDLRSDVTWHDGVPFGVEDVVFTFQYMRDAPTGRWTHHVSEIPTISSTTALDADTVRFTCEFPCPELGTVTLADLPIIPSTSGRRCRLPRRRRSPPSRSAPAPTGWSPTTPPAATGSRPTRPTSPAHRGSASSSCR